MRKLTKIVCLVFLCVVCNGCITYHRMSSTFDPDFNNRLLVGVMPIDVEVTLIKAGNTSEVMDKWSEFAKKQITKSLQTKFKQKPNVELKIIDEKWLLEQDKDLWINNRELFKTVATMATVTSIPKEQALFPTKKEKFEYTLGSDASQLAELCGVDAMLLVSGYDHESTAGRMVLGYFNAIVMGAVSGVYYVPINPSYLSMSIIDGKTGNLDWLKVTPGNVEYSYQNEKHLDNLVEWMLKEFGIRDDI